jgi:hypothetical protein
MSILYAINQIASAFAAAGINRNQAKLHTLYMEMRDNHAINIKTEYVKHAAEAPE